MLLVPFLQWLHETAGCFLPSPADSWHSWEVGTCCLMSPPYEVTSEDTTQANAWANSWIDKILALAQADYS